MHVLNCVKCIGANSGQISSCETPLWHCGCRTESILYICIFVLLYFPLWLLVTNIQSPPLSKYNTAFSLQVSWSRDLPCALTCKCEKCFHDAFVIDLYMDTSSKPPYKSIKLCRHFFYFSCFSDQIVYCQIEVFCNSPSYENTACDGNALFSIKVVTCTLYTIISFCVNM